MAKSSKKKRTHRQVRLEEAVALTIEQRKAPGQSIGGYIKQLIDGLSNTTTPGVS